MNTRSTFQKALDHIDEKIRALQEQAGAVRSFCEQGCMTEAYESALRLEETSEKAVLLTRALPAYTGNPKARLEVENLVKLSIPVEIGFTEGNWFSLRFPALLPKKDSGSADYIRSSLYLAMRDFFMGVPPVRYGDAVLIYRHVYARDRPERKNATMTISRSTWFQTLLPCTFCRMTGLLSVSTTIAAHRVRSTGQRFTWCRRMNFQTG